MSIAPTPEIESIVIEAFRYPLRPESWGNIRRQLVEHDVIAVDNFGEHQWAHLADLVSSIQASPYAPRLAGRLCMSGLWVADNSAQRGHLAIEPPVDVIVVCTPQDMNPPEPGTVRIEHCSISGQCDVITRPNGETVPLFWRFVAEKFGMFASSDSPMNAG